MTATATASRTKISLESISARPSTTTGTPLTTYSASRISNAGSATAPRISSIASRRSASLRSGRSRTEISTDSELGNRYEKRAFGSPGRRGSKTTGATKFGSPMLGSPVWS